MDPMHSEPVPSGTAQRFFDAVPASIAIARDFATTTLVAWGLTGRTDDVRLCVSELASNALTHGAAPGRGFLVRVAAVGGWVRIEVHDSSKTVPHLRRSIGTDVSGRGLHIVDELSDGWGVEEHEPIGKVVWSRFRAESTAEPTGDDCGRSA
ncbi:ATP-binding protein [Streptomyces sp. RKAG293]|uniref:ATP-binding protein n=1 Tax=Streptomyces sp. RKAG293 TaxID=2893403 RepID=UPI002033C86F|nr:ATP-binding protein [Streptomyces sp. RKAG293]MCM2421244.1 ATP-binding protein [Streptomyces sp. RKAG293]